MSSIKCALSRYFFVKVWPGFHIWSWKNCPPYGDVRYWEVWMYMYIFISILTRSSSLNARLGSEYSFDISSLLKPIKICLQIYVNSCYGLNTATLKTELLAIIVNSFYVLNASFQSCWFHFCWRHFYAD